MRQAQTLEGYARFVALVRKYGATMPPEAAINKAVTECINQGVLAEYLLARKAEVHTMLLTEYTEEEVHQEFWEDGFEIGMEEGIEKGIEEGETIGEAITIIRMVQRKLAKGKDVAVIADELEETTERIEDIIDAITAAGEGADAEAVYVKLQACVTA